MSKGREAQLLTQSLNEIRKLKARLRAVQAANRAPIAIVGVGLRLPGGVVDLDGLWRMLAAESDAIREAPGDRFDVGAFYDPDKEASGRSYTKVGAFLDDVAGFDAAFFGISPREARQLDPQQRLLLETAWEALERAGVPPDSLADSSTGVYVGLGPSDYGLTESDAGITGRDTSFAPGRMAFTLGLQGPAMAVNTACSSSLVAVHLAVKALRNGECDLALASGASVMVGPAGFVELCASRVLSADGRSKPFSSAADGYGRGEGVVTLALQRLSDARARQRPILGVIRGTAVNHVGASSGITAPNGTSQQKVIRAALADAGLRPAEVDAVECQGTGTQMGDPIEVNALASVYGKGRAAPLALGTIKPNLGHLEAAAGMAGLTRMLAALGHDTLPATPHVEPLNPHIDWDELPVEVVLAARPWPRGERVRRVGVSAFGMSGTNAHLVMEEAPAAEGAADPVPPSAPLLLSGRTAAGLQAQARRWAEWVAEQPEIDLDAMRRMAATGRSHLSHRAVIQADGINGVAAALRAAAMGAPHPAVRTGVVERPRGAVFVVPDGGASWPAMGRALLAASPAFAEAVEACDAALKPFTGFSVQAALAGEADAPALDGAKVAGPARFAMAIGLAAAWRALGVSPDAVVGLGAGDVAAAVIAGALSIADGARVVGTRSKLPAGARGPKVAAIGKALAKGLSVQPAERLLIDAAGQMIDHGALAGRDWLAPSAAAVLDVERYGVAIGLGADGDGLVGGLRVGADGIAALHAGLGALHAMGHAIDWQQVMGSGPLAPLPTQAFQRTRHWLASEAVTPRAAAPVAPAPVAPASVAPAPVAPAPVAPASVAPASVAPAPAAPVAPAPTTDAPPAEIVARLREILVDFTGLADDEIDPDAPLLDLGVQSFMVVSFGRDISRTFGVKIRATDLFQHLGTLNALARFVSGEPAAGQGVETALTRPAPPAVSAAARPSAPSAPLASPEIVAALGEILVDFTGLGPDEIDHDAPLVDLGVQSFMIVSFGREVSRTFGVKLKATALFEALSTLRALAAFIAAERGASTPATRAPASTPVAPSAPAAPRALPVYGAAELSPAAQAHLDDVIARLADHIPGSRARANPGGPLSDARVASGWFDGLPEADARQWAALEPLRYPLVVLGAEGAYVEDIDGRRYVDLCMGFGVHFFGHKDPVITRAIHDALARGASIGPQSYLANAVAEQLCDLTGMDRIAYCNTGSEAVSMALRIARLATGRARVAIATESYHGTADSVVAGYLRGVGGVPDALSELVVPFKVGDMRSLEALDAHGPELAAVLIEPVQNRHPGVHPKAFLHALRARTQSWGAALIFDEVLIGFRLGMRGAQGYFGVDADLATYGKLIGGGLPIGVVAGRGSWLDHIDGGARSPRTTPGTRRIFFGGTFSKNPLTMAAAHATLGRLQREGDAIVERLNARTAALAGRLNAWFDGEGFAARVDHAGSFFAFVMPPAVKQLLRVHLLLRGVHTWMGGTNFLTPAHAESDISTIISAVQSACREMRDAGWWVGSDGGA